MKPYALAPYYSFFLTAWVCANGMALVGPNMGNCFFLTGDGPGVGPGVISAASPSTGDDHRIGPRRGIAVGAGPPGLYCTNSRETGLLAGEAAFWPMVGLMLRPPDTPVEFFGLSVERSEFDDKAATAFEFCPAATGLAVVL